MLDPSVFLAPGGMELVSELQYLRGTEPIRVPASLLRTAPDGSVPDAIQRFFDTTPAEGRSPTEELRGDEELPLAGELPDPIELVAALRTSHVFKAYSPISHEDITFRDLSSDDLVSAILYEEWVWWKVADRIGVRRFVPEEHALDGCGRCCQSAIQRNLTRLP
jgi:hypothetical protein